MMSIVVAQMGARMHYAVPEIFHKNGFLHSLYTDLYSGKVPFSLLPISRIPGLKKLSGRQSPVIPSTYVHHYPIMGIEYVRKLRNAKTVNEQLQAYIWAGKTFSGKISRTLPFDRINAIYGFNTASVEMFRKAKEFPVKLIYEQTIAPLFIERQLLEEQENKYPYWILNREKFDKTLVDEMVGREREEMELADIIIGASSFVKDSILNFQPSVIEKCRIVPYGTKQKVDSPAKSYDGKRKLRVLVAGTVGLRKGVPQVLEASRMLKNEVEIRLVGSLNLVPQLIKQQLADAMEVTGLVPRSEMQVHYEWADVFLLPSICEGSATVTYEAMQYGLPLIVTPNTGSLIENGKQGFVIPHGNAVAIADSVRKTQDPALWRFFHENVLKIRSSVSVDAYEQRLLDCVGSLLN